MTTVYVTDERFAVHSMDGHPEFAGRLSAIAEELERSGLNAHLKRLEIDAAPDAAIMAVHTEKYVERLARTAQASGPIMFGLDTYVTPHSYAIARLAAGGVIGVVDAVINSTADNGLAAIRPPGHHATPNTGMGFCLLNNIAIAARHAQTVHGLARVLIVDFDVHHGNGTQDILYDDPSILYISTHQSPLYPGTGMIEETGHGAGIGFTLNIPLPPGVGDTGYATVLDEIVIPAAQRFDPELVLVSAGFDAHWADPLANMRLSLAGFSTLTHRLIMLAEEICDGRIVFVLEGGYNLKVLSRGWSNVARALLGQVDGDDPVGTAPGQEPVIAHILDRIKHVHKLA